MDRRPVEILEATVRGYDLEFQVIKKATPWIQCERVGEGSFDPEMPNLVQDELRESLGSHFEVLAQKCEELRTHPNAESIDDVYLASSGRAVRVAVTYRLRGGMRISQNHYFDFSMNSITKEEAIARMGA